MFHFFFHYNCFIFANIFNFQAIYADPSRMKRIIDERIVAIPHDIFADNEVWLWSCSCYIIIKLLKSHSRCQSIVYHIVFYVFQSDTESANSNIDEDKRETPRFFHDDDHDYFTQTAGLSDILVGINPTITASRQVKTPYRELRKYCRIVFIYLSSLSLVNQEN